MTVFLHRSRSYIQLALAVSLSIGVVTSQCVCVFGADDDVVIGEKLARSEADETDRLEVQAKVALVQQVKEKNWNIARGGLDGLTQDIIRSYQRAQLTLNSDLERIITQLNHICQLTDFQKHKLQLAGRVDRNHFFDRVHEVRRQCWDGKSAECKAEIQLLQIKTVSGILGSDSFFAKYIRRTLSKEQLMKVEECRRSNRLGSIELTLDELESVVKLESSQRDALSQLMLDEVPYPGDFENFGPLLGNSEKMSLKYHLWQMADEKVRPLLDPLQWEVLQPHLQECRSFRRDLTQRGLIALVADNAAAINPAQVHKEQK